MWPFKKKIEEEKKKEKKKEYLEGKKRFSVIVHQDEGNYKIDVYDNWSVNYLPKEDREKGLVRCRTTIRNLSNVEDIDEEINKIIREIKVELRENLVQDRKKFIEKKPKKKKEVKND